MNNETLNGMDNSWIISQLKRLGQDKVKQIEQLQAENKEQKTTIELLRKELLRLKSELSEIVKSLDKELANDEKEVNKGCVGSIKELDDDLILEEFEEKVKEEGEHIIEELKDKIKNPVKVFHLSLEIMALIVDEKYKELFNLLDRYGIQSSLPILLEQYNEFKENGCKQVER
jgi:hypothetical protein|nr:MAG TPA: SH3 DOMAIN-CONTAINING KINASE-BINDING PROTEIN 1 PROTEIN, CBL-INTERACTING PROTEIN OF [Bacteriophage sp.]